MKDQFSDRKNCKVKTARVFLFLMVLSILWCADVFAHMTPVAHFCPGTSDGLCEETVCDVGSDFDGGHGHIDDYRDVNENNQYDPGVDDATAWGYWDKGGYAATGNTDTIGCSDGNGGNNGGTTEETTATMAT